jgi:hypothetical protein
LPFLVAALQMEKSSWYKPRGFERNRFGGHTARQSATPLFENRITPPRANSPRTPQLLALCCSWLFLAVPGCYFWLFLAVPGCYFWLFLAVFLAVITLFFQPLNPKISIKSDS